MMARAASEIFLALACAIIVGPLVGAPGATFIEGAMTQMPSSGASYLSKDCNTYDAVLMKQDYEQLQESRTTQFDDRQGYINGSPGR